MSTVSTRWTRVHERHLPVFKINETLGQDFFIDFLSKDLILCPNPFFAPAILETILSIQNAKMLI